MIKQRTGVIAAGLALFSMFFGAGDLIWPLILGGTAGDQNFYMVSGLLITGVSLPLLGLMSMMLFRGDYRAFFGRTGKVPAIILIFAIQLILGPLGSLPRLITLSFATLQPYLPAFISLGTFSILAGVLVFLFTLKRSRVVDILGLVLCPILLLSLGAILVAGFLHHPAPETFSLSKGEAFGSGLLGGYNTLDLIASFIFAPLVLGYFLHDEIDHSENRQVFRKMIKACMIAGVLLAGMFVGLSYISSYYTPLLGEHLPEERLGVISQLLLGPIGAFFSCIAIAFSCLTTAIPISLISANYIKKDLTRGKLNLSAATAISLGISAIVANIGFMGIANMLSPILQILCPGLILLCIFNILYKLYEMQIRPLPIYAAFAISALGYFII